MKDENDDISIEQDENLDDSVVAEEAAGETIKKLRTQLKECEAKAKEYLDGWQRAQADFANLRKKDEEAKTEFMKFANVGLVKDLIPVLDSFNIAVSQGHKDLEPLLSQLMGILKSNGLEELNPEGKDFDPREHEAMGTIKTEKEEDDDKVLQVAQKGYSVAGKVIRPAKVLIGEFTNNN